MLELKSPRYHHSKRVINITHVKLSKYLTAQKLRFANVRQHNILTLEVPSSRIRLIQKLILDNTHKKGYSKQQQS